MAVSMFRQRQRIVRLVLRLSENAVAEAFESVAAAFERAHDGGVLRLA